MAPAAETQIHLYESEYVQEREQEFLDYQLATSLDRIPGIEFAWRRARQVAESIYEARMEQLRQGQFEAVPLPLDMTGTARKVNAAAEHYGEGSPEFRELHEGLLMDTERQIGEATSKLTYAYFEPLTHTYAPEHVSFVAYSQLMTDIVGNGISPMSEPEDIERSINDFVGEAGEVAFLHTPYADEYVVIHISECADWALDQHQQDTAKGKTNGSYAGYVPGRKKAMIAVSSFDTTKMERTIDRVALPGELIEAEIMPMAAALGAVREDEELTKTERHGLRMVVHKSLIQGALDVTKILDTFAAERIGKPVFMGELADASHYLTYKDIPVEAAYRKAEFAQLSRDLAAFMRELEYGHTDRWATEGLVDEFLKKRLLKIVKANPERAREIFDDATADGYLQVQALEQAGFMQEAAVLEARVAQAAPPPSSCRPGSCGLESVDDEDVAAAKKLGLSADKKDLVKDVERKCTCGAKNSIIYDTANMIKGCKKCGKTADIKPVKSVK